MSPVLFSSMLRCFGAINSLQLVCLRVIVNCDNVGVSLVKSMIELLVIMVVE